MKNDYQIAFDLASQSIPDCTPDQYIEKFPVERKFYPSELFWNNYNKHRKKIHVKRLQLAKEIRENLHLKPTSQKDPSAQDVPNESNKAHYKTTPLPFGRPRFLKLLPNVRDFEIEINKFDQLFLKYGITKRIKPDFNYQRYTNGAINKYLDHQERRLIRAGDKDPKVF